MPPILRITLLAILAVLVLMVLLSLLFRAALRKRLVTGAFPSFCCSTVGWGAAIAALVILAKAANTESPDGTGAILGILISVPLILAAVVLWLTGLIWGWLKLRRTGSGKEEFWDRIQARTAIALSCLPFAILLGGVLFLLVAAGTGKDIRDYF
jgi:hypothetical protein